MLDAAHERGVLPGAHAGEEAPDQPLAPAEEGRHEQRRRRAAGIARL